MGNIIEVSHADRVVFESCYAQWNDEQLTIGNALIERRWLLRDGLLYPESLHDGVYGPRCRRHGIFSSFALKQSHHRR